MEENPKGDSRGHSADNTSDSPEKNTLTTPETPSENTVKDNWDKIEILARPISAALTALTIAIIGWWGQTILTKMSATEADAHLYTELLSRREESESMLRKDMFMTIIKDFFEKETNSVSSGNMSEKLNNKDISKKLLKLEMLALNFGDSLSLNPLFSELNRDIHTKNIKFEKNEEMDSDVIVSGYKKRLRSLAKRVAGSQLAIISQKGKTFEFDIDYEKVVKEKGVSYTHRIDEMEYDKVKRSFVIQFSNADPMKRSIEVELTIEELEEGNIDKHTPSVEKEFTLDFFNFPMIDNTRLTNNHRFAMVMESINEEYISIHCVLFPAMYSSQRDKPVLSEAIDQLRDESNTKDDRKAKGSPDI